MEILNMTRTSSRRKSLGTTTTYMDLRMRAMMTKNTTIRDTRTEAATLRMASTLLISTTAGVAGARLNTMTHSLSEGTKNRILQDLEILCCKLLLRATRREVQINIED